MFLLIYLMYLYVGHSFPVLSTLWIMFLSNKMREVVETFDTSNSLISINPNEFLTKVKQSNRKCRFLRIMTHDMTEFYCTESKQTKSESLYTID